MLSCTLGSEGTREAAKGLARRARAAEAASNPRGAVMRVHKMSPEIAEECVKRGGAACARVEGPDDEYLLITEPLSWPKVHPLRAADRHFRTDIFAASGRAMLTAPVRGAYEFSVRCPGGSEACGVQIGGADAAGARMEMAEGASVPLEFWLVHADHGTRLEVDVTLYPDPASGLPRVVDIGAVPGDWLSHHAEDEGWGGDGALHMQEHAAWLRPKVREGTNLTLLHQATAQVHACSLATPAPTQSNVYSEVGIHHTEGVEVVCKGEGLDRGYLHNHAGHAMAARQHDPPHVWVGEARGCTAERGDFNATYMRCRLPTAAICGSGPAPLRVWLRGSGWARMHTPVSIPRPPCPPSEAPREEAPARRRGVGLSNSTPCLNKCKGGGDCVIEAGESFLLCESINVRTLTIRGELKWDTCESDLELRTGWAILEGDGYFQLGLPEAPMLLPATIYITNNGATHPMDELEKRFFAGVGSGTKIDVHGRPMARTWSLLAETAFAGDKILFLKDNPLDMGWKVGDRVGIAATSHSNDHNGTGINSQSSHRRIARIEEAEQWNIPTTGETVQGPFGCDQLSLGHCCAAGQNCGGHMCPATSGTSSCDESRGVGLAVDGDIGTRFALTNSGSGQVDFERSAISSVRVYFHDRHESSVEVLIADYDTNKDTINEQSVGTFASGVKGWNDLQINPPIEGRRLVLRHNGGGELMVIQEMTVQGK
eukprot:Hpha_TRINITY_DN10391_c0_g1::TRINITY_DN10391_c0_g1_i1::g.115990::m.115990